MEKRERAVNGKVHLIQVSIGICLQKSDLWKRKLNKESRRYSRHCFMVMRKNEYIFLLDQIWDI